MAMVVLAGLPLTACGADASHAESLRSKLVRMLNVGDCVMENEAFSPQRGAEDYQRGFLERANLRAVVACTTGGPLTNYFRFDSHAALLRAFADYPRARRHQLCVFNHELFDGDYLPGANNDLRPQEVCRRARGTFLRPTLTRSQADEVCRRTRKQLFDEKFGKGTGIDCAYVP
jgi:hypothetical protein